jgi:hypothetical protein
MSEMSIAQDLASIPRVEVANVHRVESLVGTAEKLIVAVVGGSGAGKSTLAHGAARTRALRDHCQVVRRISTRESRMGDANDGLTSVSWEYLRRAIECEELILAWERPLSDGSSIGYGCLAPKRGNLPIAMGGHGLYTNVASVRPRGVLERCVLIGVYAPTDERYRRVSLRSPDMVMTAPNYLDRMLAHDDARMFASVDIVINNYEVGRSAAVRSFSAIVGALIARRDELA